MGFRSNTGPDPLNNHKATKSAFNIAPHRHASKTPFKCVRVGPPLKNFLDPRMLPKDLYICDKFQNLMNQLFELQKETKKGSMVICYKYRLCFEGNHARIQKADRGTGFPLLFYRFPWKSATGPLTGKSWTALENV